MDAESEGRIRVSYLVADGEKCNLVRYLEPDGLPATLYQLAVRVGIDVERLAAEAEQEVRTKHGARAKGITKLIVHALAELWPKLASALPPPRAPELGGFVLHPLAAIKRRRTAAGKAGPPSGAGPPEGLKPSAKAQARSAALSAEPGCASSVAGGLYEPYASWAQVDADWSEDVKSLLSLIGGGISAGGSDSGGGSAGGGDAGGGGAGDGDAGGGSAGGGDAGGGDAGGGGGAPQGTARWRWLQEPGLGDPLYRGAAHFAPPASRLVFEPVGVGGIGAAPAAVLLEAGLVAVGHYYMRRPRRDGSPRWRRRRRCTTGSTGGPLRRLSGRRRSRR